MARILRITPEMAGVPAAAPLARQGDTPSAWPAVAKAATSLASTVETTGNQLIRIQGALQAEDAKLDMQERFNKLKFDFANREIEIREGIEVPQPGPTTASDMNGGVGQPSALAAAPELPGPVQADPTAALVTGPVQALTNLPALIQPAAQPSARPLQPKDYAQIYGKELDKMVDESVKGLKYPGMERVYRAQIAPYVGAQKIEALNRGIKLQHATMLIKDDLAAREEEQTAVTFTDPDPARQAAVRQGAFNARVDRIARFVESGLMSAEQAKTALQQFRHNVDRGSAIRDFADPELRAGTVGKLVTGQWAKSMTYEEQITLARTLSDQDDAKRRQREADAKNAADTEYKAAISSLYDRALKKDLSEGDYNAAVTRWQLTREDQKALRDAMEAGAPEPASDPVTLDNVTMRVHSTSPNITERELNQLRDARKLNFKDWRAALDTLDSRRKWHIDRGESENGKRHAQAEQVIRAALGIPTMFDKLEAGKEKAYGLALLELTRRSYAFAGGKEDPLKIAEEIIPRYQKMLDQSAAVTEDQVNRVLKYPDQKVLDVARDRGDIGGGDYDTQRRLLIDRDKRRREREVREAGEKLQQDLKKALGKGGTTKTPGGGGAVVKPD